MRIGDYSGLKASHNNGMRNKPAVRSTGYQRTDRIDISTEMERRRGVEIDRLAAIRTGADNGIYFRPSLARSVAERIIDSNDLEGSLLMGAEKTDDSGNERETSDVRRDRVDEVKKRLSSGKYSDGEIVKIIADRLLDQLASKNTHTDDGS
ncbi:MAG: hypothetical protein ABIK83_13510 [Candidatus Zixiibacteriota bacterium]